MRILFALLQKEFIQIKRNKTILRLIIVLPVVQLLILVNAATLEMNNLQIAVYDNDDSASVAGWLVNWMHRHFSGCLLRLQMLNRVSVK